MSEKRMWQTLNRALGPHWHAVRVENALAPGFPDISWASGGKEGLLELKYLPAWPIHPNTPALRGLRKEQEFFLYQRATAGGNVALLIKVGIFSPDWLLFTGHDLLRIVDQVAPPPGRTQLEAWATWRCQGSLKPHAQSLLAALRGEPQPAAKAVS